MARKGWENLADSTRKRYLSYGRRRGLSEKDVRKNYETGGDLSAYRGHRKPKGVTESSWSRVLRLAKTLSWRDDEDPRDVLENEIQKGHSLEWLEQRLQQRKADTRYYRRNTTEPNQPGRMHWRERNLLADNSLYWYH